MTEVRIFPQQIRLQKLAREPGGIAPEDALARAERNLEGIRVVILRVIQDQIREINTLSRMSEIDHHRIYVLSDQVFGEAGVYGLAELAATAHSLCALIGSDLRGPAIDAAVRLHADALLLFRCDAPSGTPTFDHEVLEGLRSVSARALSRK